tara:strand:+ start:89 stop:256 length:168 start_codon:yes stop_codon:yes gene_type:complete
MIYTTDNQDEIERSINNDDVDLFDLVEVRKKIRELESTTRIREYRKSKKSVKKDG